MPAKLNSTGLKTLQAIVDLEPGERLVYCRTGAPRDPLPGAAEAYDRGFCELVQVRTGKPNERGLGTFGYVAIRRKNVVAPRFTLYGDR